MRRELLVSVGIMIAGAGLVAAGLYWLSGALDASASQIAELRVALARRSRSLEVLAQLKRDAPSAALYEAAFDSAVLNENELLEVPDRVSALAKRYAVTASFSFLSQQSRTATGGLPSADFTLEAESTYGNIVRFLASLESGREGVLASVDAYDIVRIGERYRLVGRGRIFFDKEE